MYKDRIWYKEIVGKTKLRFDNSPQTEDDVYTCTKSWRNTHCVECYVYDSLGSVSSADSISTKELPPNRLHIV